GALAGHRERHERIGKEDRVPKREDRQLRWNRQRPGADGGGLWCEVLDLIAHLATSFLSVGGLADAEGSGLRVGGARFGTPKPTYPGTGPRDRAARSADARAARQSPSSARNPCSGRRRATRAAASRQSPRRSRSSS